MDISRMDTSAIVQKFGRVSNFYYFPTPPILSRVNNSYVVDDKIFPSPCSIDIENARTPTFEQYSAIYIYIHDSIIRLFFITLIWYENFAKVEQICHLPGRIVSVARSIERQQRTLSTSCFVLLCTKVEIEILKRHALHPCANRMGEKMLERGKKSNRNFIRTILSLFFKQREIFRDRGENNFFFFNRNYEIRIGE